LVYLVGCRNPETTTQQNVNKIAFDRESRVSQPLYKKKSAKKVRVGVLIESDKAECGTTTLYLFRKKSEKFRGSIAATKGEIIRQSCRRMGAQSPWNAR
jgi:hypothetical protein